MNHPLGTFFAAAPFAWSAAQRDALVDFQLSHPAFSEFIRENPTSSSTSFDRLTIPFSLWRSLGFADLDEHYTNFRGERIQPLVEAKIRDALKVLWDEKQERERRIEGEWAMKGAHKGGYREYTPSKDVQGQGQGQGYSADQSQGHGQGYNADQSQGYGSGYGDHQRQGQGQNQAQTAGADRNPIDNTLLTSLYIKATDSPKASANKPDNPTWTTIINTGTGGGGGKDTFPAYPTFKVEDPTNSSSSLMLGIETASAYKAKSPSPSPGPAKQQQQQDQDKKIEKQVASRNLQTLIDQLAAEEEALDKEIGILAGELGELMFG
ncbi:hypothetical protein LZ554_009594 [Drepanopeziza brunnea f. sp. 'monogermtubi']|nr:hypothetical protein LZ554_009594 [Drepanopeziza brunnea f. sp. 'monogermtubi']